MLLQNNAGSGVEDSSGQAQPGLWLVSSCLCLY